MVSSSSRCLQNRSTRLPARSDYAANSTKTNWYSWDHVSCGGSGYNKERLARNRRRAEPGAVEEGYLEIDGPDTRVFFMDPSAGIYPDCFYPAECGDCGHFDCDHCGVASPESAAIVTEPSPGTPGAA